MEEKIYTNTTTSTVGEELDRLEVPAGKIGLNSQQQSIALLKGLDAVYVRLETLNPDSQSRKVAETQFEGIVAKLRSESARFLRDVGGAQVLQQERQKINPPAERGWWFLDELVRDQQKKALRRGVIIGGAVLAVLLVVVLVYNAFLAPDPEVAAVYGHQSIAQDRLVSGDLDAALAEVEQGLAISPQDAGLLITKGVIQDVQGQPALAEQSFATAQQALRRQDEFYVTRAQYYLLAQQPEKALADAQEAVKINPEYAQAYLISGQVYEVTQQYEKALDEYDKAFAVAEKSQPELAAVARMRTAMLLQSMGAQMPSFEAGKLTPTPAK